MNCGDAEPTEADRCDIRKCPGPDLFWSRLILTLLFGTVGTFVVLPILFTLF